MSSGEELPETWPSFVELLEGAERAIARVKAVNVNAAGPRTTARELVQEYFRRTRPDLIALGATEDEVAAMDGDMQSLLMLANGRNAKTSYRRILGNIRKQAQRLELAREYYLGEQRHADVGSRVVAAGTEARILATLRDLAPTAALSYEQAFRDLAATDRVSYRGTANELREALRETIDRLAPDAEVMKAKGFKLEKNQTKPTQKQKVRHILRSRQVSTTARKTPEESVLLVEELTASVARASSERSSLSTHIASTEREVRQLKMYVDSVLAELLQVH
jgi:hypothetical protein